MPDTARPISFSVKCDRCDNEATVHELTVHNRKRQERHLCEACAKGQGMSANAPPPPSGHIPITHLLNEFITSQVQGSAAAPSAAQAPAGVCRSCGLTLNHFRQTGLLGCPDCYAAFESQLAPLLQKAHEGASQHVGKRPARLRGVDATAPVKPPAATRTPSPRQPKPAAPASAAPAPDPNLIAATLQKKLTDAIAEERYEDAAKVRDELLKLEQMMKSTPTKAARKSSSTRAPKPPPAPPSSGPEGSAA